MHDSCRLDQDEGFTLVELLVVAGIIGILVGIAFLSFTFSIERTKRIACESNQRILEDAASVYTAVHESPPDQLSDLDQYTKNFNSVRFCPADNTVELEWDVSEHEITCALHP